jgi:N-acyl-D-amino-acid deacylase
LTGRAPTHHRSDRIEIYTLLESPMRLAMYMLVAGVVGGPFVSAPTPTLAQVVDYDLLILDGRVVDGTGAPPFRADVAVLHGRIATVGSLTGARARDTIRAGGRVVAPGFIDLHSHADDARPGGLRSIDPRRRAAPNLVTQGVTTVVVNQDGRSPWPIAQQRSTLTARGIGPNAILLAGHGTIRARAMVGDMRRPATGGEVREMRRLLRQAMDEGAAGLSAGLEYEPGRWATTGELVELMHEVAARGGVYIAHQRSEGLDPMWYLPSRDAPGPATLVDAVRETIEIGERTGATVVASHVKAKGVDSWGASDTVIALIRRARDRGVRVYADLYPYTTSGSDGDTRLIPSWVYEGYAVPGAPLLTPRGMLTDVLRNTVAATALRRDIAHEVARRGGGERLIIFDHPDPDLVGRSLAELAARDGVDVVEAVIALQLDGFADRPGGARVRGFSMDEGDVDRYAREPWVATASDAGITLPGDGPVHARFYGTFPRMLARTALERNIITLEAAVRSMTALPAEILSLSDRGIVRRGYVADLVVIDLDRLADTATFFDSHRYAYGIDHVLVGGVAVVDQGMPTWALPGAVLTPGREMRREMGRGGAR